MKVLHISTEAAANYAYIRLHNSLLQMGIESKFLVLGQKENLDEVYMLKNNILNKATGIIKDRISSKRLSKETILFNSPFATGETGYLLGNHPLVQEADIIHIHWIRNILSVDSIRQLIKMKKKIVWTCHDSWAFTGGCYVRYGCMQFCEECGKCPELCSDKSKDLSYNVLQKKKKAWKGNTITFIAPSNWMKQNILKSSLFRDNQIVVIPNALDLDIYKRSKQRKTVEKKNILFGAADAQTPYKGFKYLIKMLEEMLEADPLVTQKYCLQFVGTDKIDNPILNRFECKFWGFISGQSDMAQIYSSVDVFVCPSLDDNLPGMVMESMACETPVVAFKTGGIPDMINHKQNGYLAEYGNSRDLTEGLKWILENNEDGELGLQARKKVLDNYSMKIVAQKHIDLYNNLLNQERK